MSFGAPFVHTISVLSPGVATANADDDFVVGEFPFAGTVTEVTYTPDANVAAGDGTNNRELSLINEGQSGAGTTSIATLTSNANAWTGQDEKAFTLSGTPANLVGAAGDVLRLNSNANGTGAVDPGGSLQVKIARTVADI